MRYLFVLLLFFLFGCTDERETVKPVQKEIVEAVYSSVLIEPKDTYKVNASSSGYLEQMLVSEGDEVRAGDLLFILSNKPTQLNQKNMELNYQLLKDSYLGDANLLEEMRLELKSIKLKMQNDSLNYFRFKQLYEKNAASKFDYDNATLTYEVSKNNLSSLKTRIIRKEKELKNQLSQSKNNMDVSSLRTDDFYIRSNIEGKVYQLFKEKGELVSMQEPLAILGNKKEFRVKMLIDEVDITKVDLKQKVLVTLEAFGDRVFEASIVKIASKMDERTQTFEVEAEFTKAPKKMYMGLTGEGNIIINERKRALVIPREYLMVGNKVETNDGIKVVKTGISNWNFIEILSGLDENSVIYKPQ